MVAAVAGIGRNAERMITRLAGAGKTAAKSRLEIRQRLLGEIAGKSPQSQRYYNNDRLIQMFDYIEKKFSALPDFIRKTQAAPKAATPKVKTFAQRLAECNDEKAAKRLSGEISKKMARLQKEGVEDLLKKDFKSLTPEQQAKVKEWRNYQLANKILERKKVNFAPSDVAGKTAATAAEETSSAVTKSETSAASESSAAKEGKKTPWGWIIGCTAGGLGIGGVAGARTNGHKLDAVA